MSQDHVTILITLIILPGLLFGFPAMIKFWLWTFVIAAAIFLITITGGWGIIGLFIVICCASSEIENVIARGIQKSKN